MTELWIEGRTIGVGRLSSEQHRRHNARDLGDDIMAEFTERIMKYSLDMIDCIAVVDWVVERL
jgi:hypothetical protein